MKKNISITMVIYSLHGGGAERVLVTLAEGLFNRGYDVHILTLEQDVPDFYTVPVGVKRSYAPKEIFMACGKSILCRLKRRKYLQKAILDTEPDIVISFMDIANIRTLYALFGTGIPVIATEHIDPRKYQLTRIWEILRLIWYPVAAQVVMLTNELKKWAEKVWPFTKISVINNPIIPPKINLSSERPWWFGKKNLIAMGRLNPQKGFDLLIEAFNIIADDYPEWNLTILGEGKLRENLENEIKKYKLENRIFLPGAINPPFDILRQADIFVFPSRFEGFPLALCEAMACGLPVISTDCPTGPAEIIRNNYDGILIPTENVDILSETLSKLMSDEKLRKNLAAKAPEVIERFSLEKILNQWESLIFDVLLKK